MGIRSRLFGGAEDDTRPSAVEVDDELAEDLHRRAGEQGTVITIVPYKRDGGFPKNRAFFKSVHSIQRDADGGNETPPFAFELVYWKESRRIGFRYACSTTKQRRAIRRAAESCYHDADIEEQPEPVLDIEAGQSLAAGRLALRADGTDEHLMPINNYKLSPDEFQINPYDSITSEMVGDTYGSDASVVVQLTCKPAVSLSDESGENWHDGADRLAKDLSDPEHGFRFWGGLADFFYLLVDEDHDVEVEKEGYQTSTDTTAADVVADQRGQLGYHVNVRILCIGDDDTTVRERLEHVCEKYRNFYNANHGQGFRGVFEDDPVEVAKRVASREWVDREMPMSLDSLAGLAGPPMDLSTSEVEYTYTQNDEGQPPGIETFGHYDQTGITDELAAHQDADEFSESADGDEGSFTDRLGAAMRGEDE